MFRHKNKSFKPWNGRCNIQMPVLIAFVIFVFVALMLFFHVTVEKPSSSIELITQKWNSFDALVRFDPIVEFLNGTDVIWQVPDSPKAVLFLAHGCNGKAADFWDKSPRCPNCVGLPEERLVVLHALARKFAVITISSMGRCWSFGEELFVVEWIIKWWVEKQNLEQMPLVALGASSGGYFVSVLATHMNFSSIVLMIAEGMFYKMDILNNYPPTLFVHMPKDETRKRKINKNFEVLRAKGIDVSEIKCMPFPLSPNFFYDRIPGLDQTISRKLYNLFREKGFIDNNGYMTNDGRMLHWKPALKERQIVLLDKSLINRIQEELNVAFAYHEMTSLQSKQIFGWFESYFS